MNTTGFFIARGHQVLAVLLAAVPLAERMLLYHLVTAALVMIPLHDGNQGSVS